MTAVFVQGSPVWLLKRTMQWPLSNRQSTQFAETALPEACGIKLETFLKIRKAESNRTTQKLDSRHLLFLCHCPDMPRCGFSHPIKKAARRRACDGSTFFFLRQVQQKSLWNDSPHHPISQTFPPRLFCEVHILVVFQPSVGLVLKDEKWNLHESNYPI